MTAELLALVAKAPIPGQVKTRLTPALTAEAAASLYEAMLLDILDQSAQDPGHERVLWYTPAESRSWFRRMVPAGYRLELQQGAELGTRMREVFRYHAREGYSRMVLRGTDSPTLPQARVLEAFEALSDHDVVLCPDRDGGYNLIGLREPCDALFEIEFGLPNVLDRTCDVAAEQGLRVKRLEAHFDVDCLADLERLESSATHETTPRTCGWLNQSRARICP